MNTSESFHDIIARLGRGESRAASEVFQRFADRLIALARARLTAQVRQKVDPEDVLQSVCRSFFVRQADGQFVLGSWDELWSLLTVLTVRKCANRARHLKAARRAVVL